MNTRFALLFVLILVSTAFHANAQTADYTALTMPTDCPMSMPANVQVICGYYDVPENRNVPDSTTIRLPFAILKSFSDTPDPDPVVFPSNGGPGASSLDAMVFYTQSSFLQERDFIFVEQRGNRYAEPALECPDVQMAIFANYTTLDNRETEIAREVHEASQCRDNLISQGVDLTAYNSVESAADLETLRQLLGYEQWNLVGGSYAARLVLTTMSLYPDGIRSVVLDSVYNPSVNAYEQRVPTLASALEILFANCGQDSECQQDYPDLEAHFYAVIESMNVTPLSVDSSHPVTGEPIILQLTGDDLIVGIFNALYQRNTIRFLPFLIEELYQGNTSVLEPLAQTGFSGIFSIAQGMYYSTECREEYPFNDLNRQQEIARNYPLLANFLPSISEPSVCAIWGAGIADERNNQPVYSDIPSLVLAGEYDPVTAPIFTEQVATTLSNSFFYRLPYFGHGVQSQSNCANQLAAAFIEQPEQESTTKDCLEHLTPLDFITTGNDIVPTPIIYRIQQNLLAVQSGLFVIGLLLIAFMILVQMSASMLMILKKHIDPLWILSDAFAIAFVLGCIWLYQLLTATDTLLLAFGIPLNMQTPLILTVIMGFLWLITAILAVARRSTH